jgi:hypothetical protein
LGKSGRVISGQLGVSGWVILIALWLTLCHTLRKMETPLYTFQALRAAKTEWARPRVIQARVSVEEAGAFDRAARLSGLTLSAWLRVAARELASRQLVGTGEGSPW